METWIGLNVPFSKAFQGRSAEPGFFAAPAAGIRNPRKPDFASGTDRVGQIHVLGDGH